MSQFKLGMIMNFIKKRKKKIFPIIIFLMAKLYNLEQKNTRLLKYYLAQIK
jgi:hypothetical protein